MSIYDAAMRYRREGVGPDVLAGNEYRSGSSRDWAATPARDDGMMLDPACRAQVAPIVSALLSGSSIDPARVDLRRDGTAHNVPSAGYRYHMAVWHRSGQASAGE
jgi:hypothetical protein